jgi:hypothetical protein
MMVGSTTGSTSTDVAVTFDDMTVLTEDGVDLFVLNWNEFAEVPPFYVDVEARRFAYASQTVLVAGRGAVLSDFVREQEAEGLTVLLVERDDRFLLYIHDPAAGADEDEEGAAE